ncbi:MAG: hypothetical protein BIFFINMI_03293 [Phycisphaerae bacterium]|nr:hypothetical protein [Phycisphaerae bacterium]
MIRKADVNLGAELNRKYPGRKVWVDGDAIVIQLPMALRKRGGRKEIILPEGTGATETPKPTPRRPLVVALAKAFKWQTMMETGQVGSIKELAAMNGVDASYIGRILRLATLAPDIIDMILAGQEPEGLALRNLSNPPMAWPEQRKRLRFREKQR